MCVHVRRVDLIERVVGMTPAADMLPLLGYFERVTETVWDKEFRGELFAVLLGAYERVEGAEAVSTSARILAHQGDMEKLATLLYRAASQAASEQDFGRTIQVAVNIAQSLPADALRVMRQFFGALAQSRDEESEQLAAVMRALDLTTIRRFEYGFLAGELMIDFGLFRHIRDTLQDASSGDHSALIISHALASSHTGRETFIAQSSGWIKKATHWGRFVAAARLGCTFKNSEAPLATVSSYLVETTQPFPECPYSAAGGLFALGMLFAGEAPLTPFDERRTVAQYMLEVIDMAVANSSEPVLHGAALALGLGQMMCPTGEEVTDKLRNVLYWDGPNAGFAAGLALGMCSIGAIDPDSLDTYLKYANSTKHEKTTRGVTLGVAISALGMENRVLPHVGQLEEARDPVVRAGGAWMRGMAFCGTGNLAQCRALLRMSSTDPSSEVARAAVLSVAFILAGHPHELEQTMKFLTPSHNPYMRAGAAIGLGLFGSKSSRAILCSLLALAEDNESFVRQHAFLALALFFNLSAAPEFPTKVEPASFTKLDTSEPLPVLAGKVRRLLLDIALGHEPNLLVRWGAVVALGLASCGGSNMFVSLRTRAGTVDPLSAVGLFLFCQFWYWHPLALALSLALKPAGLITVSPRLEPVTVVMRCARPRADFCYPAPFRLPPRKVRTKREVTQLASGGRRAMTTFSLLRQTTEEAIAMAVAGDAEQPDEEARAAEDEPTSFVVSTPTRVVPAQVRAMSFANEAQRAFEADRELSGIVVVPDAEEMAAADE
eukprot:gnl/Chilomastix_cuspidata/1255.p1 GENE.gnl/Chilomastix_cuspidata/1255~~gnl/Chilomastix_cuspidata/1255.p1  ORF type:complete len:777 (-),score=436.01 gnl/Chilomastix_cuspidata/1255:170-2500(-)